MNTSPIPEAQSQINQLTAYMVSLPIETVAQKSGRAPADIARLASNENPYGMSPRARATLRAAANSAHLYPDGTALQRVLANHHQLSPDHVILGNGSNDVLDLIARVFLGPGTEAVSSAHGFAIYDLATLTVGARSIVAPATPGLGHDLAAMHARITPATRVIWIANPNNPTGTFIPYPAVKAFLETVPPHIVVVLDEAYFEYLRPDQQAGSVKWLADHPNLILIRTFSKIYGLAGLRIGYGLMHPAIADLINRIRQPFNVNSVAAATAITALADQDFVRLSYARNRRGLQQLQTGLDRLGISYPPSAGNFLAVQMPSGPAAFEALVNHGIVVRPLAGYGLPNHLRVSVGRPAENARLLAVLEQCVNQ
jgi:histidinol-phosphate aminotransferase